MEFSPLIAQRVSSAVGKVTRRDAYSEQFRLWISKAQLDLVYGRAVLDGVGS